MSKKKVAGYILDKRIGKGSYATVWKGHVATGDEAVAVKVISRQTVTETAQLRQEVEVLRRISHPNIVRFRDLKKSPTHFYLVLEYCAGGDLSQFLREHGRAAEEVARRFLTQIAAGLCVLHRENVLHRDLKPQNILLSDGTDSPMLKIADFGFARALQPQDMAATVCGSPLYMAPEILRHEPYDARADLWSVGAIMFEVLMGKTPFSGVNPMQLLANIEKSDRLSYEGVSAEGQEFLNSLLIRSPAQRLSSPEFAQHPYVRLRQEDATQTGAGSSSSTWCLAASSPEVSTAELLAGDSGDHSPARMSPASCHTPEESPRSSASNTAFDLEFTCEPSPFCLEEASGGDLSFPTEAIQDVAGGTSENTGLFAEAVSEAAQEAVQIIMRPKSFGRSGGLSPGGGAAEELEEYVVVTAKQPVSAWARGKGPTPRAAANGFCSNLSRIAHALEQLAMRLLEPSPTEALALLLRALGLLEKALNVSLAEEGTAESIRRSFLRILDTAEAAGRQVQPAEDSPRPNLAIFEFAVQNAKEAAVALSKGFEVGGWEGACHEKLTLALLLLDLLASGADADGDDVAAIEAYTAPIARLVGEVERLGAIGQPAH